MEKLTAAALILICIFSLSWNPKYNMSDIPGNVPVTLPPESRSYYVTALDSGYHYYWSVTEPGKAGAACIDVYLTGSESELRQVSGAECGETGSRWDSHGYAGTTTTGDWDCTTTTSWGKAQSLSQPSTGIIILTQLFIISTPVTLRERQPAHCLVSL